MKKILLTLLLALPFCMVAKAQDFRVGITGGYNLSSPSGYKSQSGFHVGVKGELGLPIVTKGLYMDFGLMLSSHGWKSPGYYYDGNYNPSAGEKPDPPSTRSSALCWKRYFWLLLWCMCSCRISSQRLSLPYPSSFLSSAHSP